MRQNSFRFVCLLFGLSFLGGEMKAQQKSAHETGLRSKSTSELAELEQVITKVNYDESKVPVYTLPDVLPLTNGRKVTTKKEWVEKRRPELLREGSRFDYDCTDQEYMENFARRYGELHGVSVATDTPEHFLTDLQAAGYVR